MPRPNRSVRNPKNTANTEVSKVRYKDSADKTEVKISLGTVSAKWLVKTGLRKLCMI